MNPQFNLIDEGWIPCTMSGTAAQVERRQMLGLRDILLRAPEIQEIGDPSPLVTVALHRLLLALVHRIVDGPRDTDHWAELLGRGRFDGRVVEEYLTQVHDRFDLFDAQRPFYQVANIAEEYGLPIAKLTHELAAGNNVTLFDHTTERSARTFSPAQAARYLIAYQSYAVGGLVSFEKGQDPKIYKSAPAAPLAKGAVALVRGENLFKTLLLNLHEYDVEAGIPFRTRGADRPAWERDGETRAEERPPDGYLDLLTWQSRRIRLFPVVGADGATVVHKAAIMKGYGFLNAERYKYETMVAFRENKGASAKQEPCPAVGFRPEKALWRDSLALLRSVDGGARPRTLHWLYKLQSARVLSREAICPLDLLGMATDQASVLLWRHERLPLPLVYLDPHNKDLIVALRAALDGAERVGGALGAASKELARFLLSPMADRPDARQPAAADIGQLAASFGMERAYWPQLDIPFKDLVAKLPRDALERGGPVEYGVTELPRWAETLRRAADTAFAAPTEGLDSSARSLKAVARAQRRLNWEVGKALADIQPVARRQKEGAA